MFGIVAVVVVIWFSMASCGEIETGGTFEIVNNTGVEITAYPGPYASYVDLQNGEKLSWSTNQNSEVYWQWTAKDGSKSDSGFTNLKDGKTVTITAR
jgi:hypothetical protein